MVGVTKKEVSQMTKYYLKMDNIMKNMFVVALMMSYRRRVSRMNVWKKRKLF